jgi:hypothetical protein
LFYQHHLHLLPLKRKVWFFYLLNYKFCCSPVLVSEKRRTKTQHKRQIDILSLNEAQ